MNRPVVLVTGFPHQSVAGRLARTLLAHDREAELRLLVPKSQEERGRSFVAALPPDEAARTQLLEGDPWALDLGLSGAEYRALAAEVTVIHHAAQTTQLGMDRDEAMRRNRGSTVEALELAREAHRLDRLVLWSSVSVSGTRKGFVLEDELDLAHGTRNAVEESMRRSELLVRAERDVLPITILRPGLLVGDSRTGAIDPTEGTYHLLSLMISAPPDRPMPMPARPEMPLPLVPIDYVVRAGHHIATDPRALSGTFQIVDPDPLTAERTFELMARAIGRSIPRSVLPPYLANRLMRLPFIQPGGGDPLPRAFLDQVGTEVVYDDRAARKLLAGTGIACPAFESYVEAMVRYVREQHYGARVHGASA